MGNENTGRTSLIRSDSSVALAMAKKLEES